jgi:hypothetical protein
MAGAMVISELLRAFNGGPRLDEQFFTPRNLIDSDFCRTTTTQAPSELAKLGFCSL